MLYLPLLMVDLEILIDELQVLDLQAISSSVYDEEVSAGEAVGQGNKAGAQHPVAVLQVLGQERFPPEYGQ